MLSLEEMLVTFCLSADGNHLHASKDFFSSRSLNTGDVFVVNISKQYVGKAS